MATSTSATSSRFRTVRRTDQNVSMPGCSTRFGAIEPTSSFPSKNSSTPTSGYSAAASYCRMIFRMSFLRVLPGMNAKPPRSLAVALIHAHVVDVELRREDAVVDPLSPAPAAADGGVELDVERLVERPGHQV